MIQILSQSQWFFHDEFMWISVIFSWMSFKRRINELNPSWVSVIHPERESLGKLDLWMVRDFFFLRERRINELNPSWVSVIHPERESQSLGKLDLWMVRDWRDARISWILSECSWFVLTENTENYLRIRLMNDSSLKRLLSRTATHTHCKTHTATHTLQHTHCNTYTATHTLQHAHCNTLAATHTLQYTRGNTHTATHTHCNTRTTTQTLIKETHDERWGAGVETQTNVRGEIGGWGRVPFNEPYAPSLSTIYDGA